MKKHKYHPLIDEEKQKVAHRYHNEHLLVNLLSSFISILMLILIIRFQISQKFFLMVAAINGSRFFQAFIYFVAFYTFYALIALPFSFLGGFKIEHKFNFSTQRITDWFKDEIKSFFVGLILGVVVFETFYMVTYYFTTFWWLWLAIIMVFFSVILANLFPVLILPLFYKTKPFAEGDFKNRIKEICERAGIAVGGIYTIDLSSKSTKANAAVVGLGNTKRILLGDTLLSGYDEEEVLVTLCHEITHYQKHHIWYLIFYQSLITIATFYLLYLLYPVVYKFAGFSNISDISAFPVFILIFLFLSFIFKPLASAISRYYEKMADLGALILSNNPGAFVTLMAKFCNQELAVAYPNLFIEFFTYTHPSIGSRVEFAEKFARESQNGQ